MNTSISFMVKILSTGIAGLGLIDLEESFTTRMGPTMDALWKGKDKPQMIITIG
jgi:hypothetical protein